MGHIGNVHAKNIMPVRSFFQGYRIVQIFGFFAVDGYCLPVSDIFSSLIFFRKHRIGNFCHLGHHIFRKLFRQMISPDNRQNIHARVIDMAENFHNLSFRIFSGISEIQHLNNHLMAVHSPHGILFINKYVPGNFLIIRHDKSVIFTFFEDADHHFIGPLQDLHDHRFAPASALFLGNLLNYHFISVKGIFCIFSGNIKVIRHALHMDETEALCVSDKCPGQHIFIGRLISALIVHRRFTLGNQLIQHLFQFFPFPSRNTEHRTHFLQLHRPVIFITNKLKYNFFPHFINFFIHALTPPLITVRRPRIRNGAPFALSEIPVKQKDNTLSERVLSVNSNSILPIHVQYNR